MKLLLLICICVSTQAFADILLIRTNTVTSHIVETLYIESKNCYRTIAIENSSPPHIIYSKDTELNIPYFLTHEMAIEWLYLRLEKEENL